jgi:TetR/AcrR family transcriptional regulator, regulator of cefoperazone and chloramphenicol sensitivity
MSPRRPKRATERDVETRLRVIQAAIDCILEQGFYRASSNAIAERAGLTWGVIQYYFGTREVLMLAVLEEGTQRLLDDLTTAEITAESLEKRIEEFIAVVERYYANPEHLAFIQVLLNLSHDPRTSEETRATMMSIARPVEAELNRLAAQLFAGTAVGRATWRRFVFHVVRGLALSELMLTTLPFATTMERDFPLHRRMLADALRLLIEQEVDRAEAGWKHSNH